ncbi:MAG: LysE family translocator [Planktomarina sp.]
MTLGVFLTLVAVHFAAAVSPGPSFVMMLRTVPASGARAGAAMAVAFGIGAAIWAGLAMFGLDIVFQTVPAALTALKYAGAAFLVFIAYVTIKGARQPLPDVDADPNAKGTLAAFKLGLITQLANPNPAIFFGAVFVALVPPGAPLWIKGLILLTICVVEALWYIAVALLLSRPSARKVYGRWKPVLDVCFGAVLGLFALQLVLT